MGTRWGKHYWSPQSSLTAPQVNACGLVFSTILYSFKSQLSFTSQPVPIAVPTQASNKHLELPRTPNLLLEPAPPTAFPISRVTLAIGCTSQKPRSHSLLISRYIQNLTASHHLCVHAEMSPIIFCLDFYKSFLTAFLVSNCNRKFFHLTALAWEKSKWNAVIPQLVKNKLKLMKDCELSVTPLARPLLDLTGDSFLSSKQRTCFIPNYPDCWFSIFSITILNPLPLSSI